MKRFYKGRKYSDVLMNHNLRKRSINSKLSIHSVNIHKDFFKLIYHSYGLWVIRKDETRGIKELFKNTWLKSSRDKKELVARVFAANENGVQPIKTAVEIESDLITDYRNINVWITRRISIKFSELVDPNKNFLKRFLIIFWVWQWQEFWHRDWTIVIFEWFTMSYFGSSCEHF